MGDRCDQTGLLLVISGPSGAGKTTIARAIEQGFDDAMFSVSATTRPKTGKDTEGRDYFFLSEDAFRARVDAGEMLEHALVFSEYHYGTPRGPVEEALREGRIVILEIDVQGGLQIRESKPDAFMIFILPPSDEELLRRLRARAREDEEIIQRRFAEAKREIATAKESGAYDLFIVNENLEQAIEACRAAIQQRLQIQSEIHQGEH